MKSPWFAGCLVAACLAAAPAAADRDCNVPLADWQPREALQKKLEAEGWTVLSIRSDDGCYKVRATDAQGARLKAKFDPATLERVRRKDNDEDE
ncbi:PepSY domain-containing protein [Xanthobacter sp. V3C-3]|uniref:PepSY domain-containing protein n=1 Tax=Xanthobacter lutulentifluminis TaxID=3119935 RepID=UPI0037261ED6